MHVGGCLVLITIVAWRFTFIIAENPAKARKNRQILPLLGFLEGYKIGQNFALQLPPFVVSPIFVLPSVNQQPSVNIDGSTDDKYDESSGTVQVIAPAKLVLQDCKEKQNNIIDETAKESVNELSDDEIMNEGFSSDEDTLRQNIIATNNSTTDKEINKKEDNSVVTSTESTETTSEITTADVNLTTLAYGPYPTAIYKNEIVDTITLTEAPIDNNLVLPALEENWQNFNSQNRTEKYNTTQENIESRSDGAWNNVINYPTKPSYYGYKRYPYPPSYNNVENLYVTNSYTPARPNTQYSNNDRWQTFPSSENYQLTSQFRPLAGLYYDGYLHKAPVKNTGFVPYNNNNYYY